MVCYIDDFASPFPAHYVLDRTVYEVVDIAFLLFQLHRNPECVDCSLLDQHLSYSKHFTMINTIAVKRLLLWHPSAMCEILFFPPSPTKCSDKFYIFTL